MSEKDEDPTGSCGQCRFMSVDDECRRRAPQGLPSFIENIAEQLLFERYEKYGKECWSEMVKLFSDKATWPFVRDDDWCGDFEPRRGDPA